MSKPIENTKLLILMLALLLRVLSPNSANISYILLAAYALLGRPEAIQSLAFSWFFSMVNPGIAADASWASIGRYAIVLCASVSVFVRSGFFYRGVRVSIPVAATLLLGVIIVIHSLFVSPLIDVSVLKAVSWAITAATIFSAWNALGAGAREKLGQQLFSWLATLMVFSIPLLFSGIGYLRNGTGFQGLLGQPQAFGPTMALFAAWAGSRLIASSRPSMWTIALFFCSVLMIFMSGARTAGLSLVFGAALAVVFSPWLANKSISSLVPGLRSSRLHIVVMISLIAVLLTAPTIKDRIQDYLAKGTSSSDIASAYEASRGRLIDRMLDNIQRNPWIGIGFGIASIPEQMVVDRDPVLGLPTGAAIEKGVMPLAVLEEIGVLGSVCVGIWLWILIRRAARSGGVVSLSVFFVALLINLGESVLFSPGGLGLLLLILIGWAISAPPHHADKIGYG